MPQFSTNAMRRMTEIAEASSTSEDCKRNLMKYLGKIKHSVLHSQVLGALYITPAKTKGGIIRPDTHIKEERYQGTIFLVVGLGKGAFKDDNIAKFNGDKLKIGDWVMAVAGDGIGMDINGVPCRLYSDTRILMKVEDPGMYY